MLSFLSLIKVTYLFVLYKLDYAIILHIACKINHINAISKLNKNDPKIKINIKSDNDLGDLLFIIVFILKNPFVK